MAAEPRRRNLVIKREPNRIAAAPTDGAGMTSAPSLESSSVAPPFVPPGVSLVAVTIAPMPPPAPICEMMVMVVTMVIVIAGVRIGVVTAVEIVRVPIAPPVIPDLLDRRANFGAAHQGRQRHRRNRRHCRRGEHCDAGDRRQSLAGDCCDRHCNLLRSTIRAKATRSGLNSN